MAIVETDAASMIVTYLKDGEGSMPIRDMVQGGERGVLEAGDITGSFLAGQIAARRKDGSPDKVLCLDVQDAGDRVIAVGKRLQTVIVRIYDQDRGYRNIKAVRDLLIKTLDGYVSPLTDVEGERRAVLELMYLERSGIRYDPRFNVDFESVVFRGIMDIEEGD